MSATVRRAIEADVPYITEVVHDAYRHYVERLGAPPRPMTENYEKVVNNRTVLVAEIGSEIVGLIVLGVDDEGFFVDNVAVDPSHQSQGIGRTLLQTAEVNARRAGFDSIYLYTHERMTENRALYSRIGYLEYDRRKRGGASIVYMRKQLSARAAPG